MLRSIRPLAAAGLVLAAPGAPTDAHRPATPAAPAAVLTLQPYRTRWTLDAVVSGTKRTFIFDSGGGISFLSSEVARSVGCRPWGRLTGFNMFATRGATPRCDGTTFDIDGHRFTPETTGLIDLGKLNPRDSTLDGLIALDIFAGQTITLDLARGRIVVESPASRLERVRGMTPLPIHVNREVEGFAVSVLAAVPSDRGTLWMELDSGNGGTILVSRPVASLVGLDSAAQGRQTADFALLPGVHVQSADAFTPDMIMDGNLGMPFLRHWLVTLDLATGRAWIAPNPAA